MCVNWNEQPSALNDAWVRVGECKPSLQGIQKVRVEPATRSAVATWKKKKQNVLVVWWPSGSVLSQCLFEPLGVLLDMKALKDEWYIVTKASTCKFTIFEIFYITIYCMFALPSQTESTDSLICHNQWMYHEWAFIICPNGHQPNTATSHNTSWETKKYSTEKMYMLHWSVGVIQVCPN